MKSHIFALFGVFGAVRKCSSHARTIHAEVVDGDFSTTPSLLLLPPIQAQAGARLEHGVYRLLAGRDAVQVEVLKRR